MYEVLIKDRDLQLILSSLSVERIMFVCSQINLGYCMPPIILCSMRYEVRWKPNGLPFLHLVSKSKR